MYALESLSCLYSILHECMPQKVQITHTPVGIPFLRCVLQSDGEGVLGDCPKSIADREKQISLSDTLWPQLSTTNTADNL